MQSSHPQGAAVTYASTQNPPRVGEIVPIAPRRLEHLAEMPGLGLQQAERDGLTPAFACGGFDAVAGGCGVQRVHLRTLAGNPAVAKTLTAPPRRLPPRARS